MMIDKIFGTGSHIKILNHIVNKKTDFTVLNLEKETGISRKTIDLITKNLLEEDIILVNRVVGRTNLYVINKKSTIIKKWKSIMKCLL